LLLGFITGKVSCLDGGKCRYKLIAHTSVLAAVTESIRICHAIRKVGLQILLAGLQIALMSRFCIFFQNKTVNCNMQAGAEQAG